MSDTIVITLCLAGLWVLLLGLLLEIGRASCRERV